MPVNPDPSPTKDVAVTIPVTNTLPETVNFDVGFVVPIPTLERVLIPTAVDAQ